MVCLDCFDMWLYENVIDIDCEANNNSGIWECGLKGDGYCEKLCSRGGFGWWEKNDKI